MEEAGWNGSSALRTTTKRYRAYNAGPYPEALGGAGAANIGDNDFSERPTPMDQQVITQQGVSFTWEGSNFDIYRRPNTVTKSSSLGSRVEVTAFHDNTTNWVLNQVATVTESGTATVMESNTYDPTTANLLTITKFGSLQETRTYYGNGTINTSKDGLNQVTTYGNYKLGIPQLITYADTRTKSAVVNNLGQISSTTDENGHTTSYGYDAMGRLSSVTYPTADTVAWNGTTIQFDKVGSAEYGLGANHWRSTATTGNAKSITYFDALWRPVLLRRYDAADEANTRSMVLRRFDYNGNTTFESYPQRTISSISDSLNGTTTTLDALGRPSNIAANSELGVLNTGFAYLGGFQKQVTNPRNYSTTFSYQAFDQPSEGAIAGIAEPGNITTTIARFGKTNQITKGDGSVSATKKYVYDSKARLCKTIEPEGITVQDYNNADQVLWHAYGQASLTSASTCDQASVPAAQKVNYSYDARNRLLNTTYGDGSQAITRTYHPDGKLNTISSNGTVWTYGYNKRRLLDTETLNYLGKTYITRHGFDANGSESSLTYPDTAATVVSYNPNALGQPRAVGSYATSVAYHPNGAVASFTYGNGIAHTMTPNTRGLPQQVIDTGVLNDTYTYDQNGNATGITDNQENIATRSMTYTPVDYLETTTASNLWGTATYGNDAIGNIRSVAISAGPTARNSTINYNAATNRIDSIVTGGITTSYGYDRQGNISTRGSEAYVFDGANRMTSATGKATYVYDGNGRRVVVNKTDGTKLIQVYTQAGLLVLGTSQVGTGSITESRYGYLNDSQVAELGVNYVHTDGLRSPVARTNAGKTILSRTRYEPYGRTAGGTTGAIGFGGHVNDADTGLVYMQQRYFEPLAGRFMSLDPVLTDVSTASSFNRYNYANNSPYKYVDPDGRYALNVEACLGKCIGITLGYAALKTELWHLLLIWVRVSEVEDRSICGRMKMVAWDMMTARRQLRVSLVAATERRVSKSQFRAVAWGLVGKCLPVPIPMVADSPKLSQRSVLGRAD